MASNYPGALDGLATDYEGTDQADVVDHAGMHNDVNAAINAVQTELGTDPSGAAATVKARFEAIEANDWVTAARIAANAVGSSELADGSVTAAKIGALTTKGDLLSRDGSGAVRLPVGTDGQVLVASSAATSGVVWSNGAVQARTTSGAITLLDTVVTADTTSGAVTLTLPAASGCTGKAIRIIKTAGANTLTVARAGSDTITPSSGTRTSVAFPSDCAMGEIVLVSSGTSWHVVSGQASDESVGSRLYKWSQALAAGSTTAAVGWRLVSYDSGRRILSSWDTAGTVTGLAFGANWGPRTGVAGRLVVRRTMDAVAATVTHVQTTGAVSGMFTIPAGFTVTADSSVMAVSASADCGLTFNGSTIGRANSRVIATGTVIYEASVVSSTTATLPTSLPGTAA